MWRLTLRTPVLKNRKGMQIKLGLVTNHVNYHENHLFLLVRELDEVDLGQLELIVNLEHVFVSRKRVYCVVV